MKYCFILLLVAVPAFTFSIEDPSWQTWKFLHSKSYEAEGEENVRYLIWQENMKIVNEFNLHNKGMRLKMNHLGDLTENEFRYKVNGLKLNKKNLFNKTSQGSIFLEPHNVQLPRTVDWREKGYVTHVENQGACGASWAVSATGSLEGQLFKKTGKLVSLSEQNLVDCCGSFGCGCQGGFMTNAFRCIMAEGGIESEADYPNTGEKGTCHFKKTKAVATVTGYVDIASGNETALKVACATVGPISVAIDASHVSFQFYASGVYDEKSCSSTSIDLAVLLVGYGTTPEGTDYWLVKNSWGTSWGMEGYMKMSRNKNNQCGIATNASYPLV